MFRSQFAGLTILDPGEGLATDGFSFQHRNPQITDQLLKVGAVTHKHDGHVALARPEATPSASIVASGGTLPADADLMVGFTVTDATGGETLVSPTVSVTTPPAMAGPSSPPLASADYTGGTIGVGTYFYVRSYTDNSGGETLPSPYVTVTRAPGHASGQVLLAGLTQGMVAVGATGWRLYKAALDGQFRLLKSGTTDTFTDDGTVCADASTTPRTTNTTVQHSTLLVTIPPLPSGSVTFRVYVGLGAGFTDPSLVGEYPAASAGTTIPYVSYNPSNGRPPDVPTAMGGANQIDPDTDILEWPWKRSVATQASLPAGVAGDVRLSRATHRIYTPSGATAAGASGWTEVPGNVLVVASGSNNPVKAQTIVVSGGTVTASGASAIVAVASGGGGGGGGAESAYFNAWGDSAVIDGGDSVYWQFDNNRVMVGGTSVSVDWDVSGVDSLVCGSSGLWLVEFDIACSITLPDGGYPPAHEIQWVELDHYLTVPYNVVGAPANRPFNRFRVPVRVGKRVDGGSNVDDNFVVSLDWKWGHKFYVAAGHENEPLSYFTRFRSGNFTDGELSIDVTSVSVTDKNWATLAKLG